jgi:hypothetical protein
LAAAAAWNLQQWEQMRMYVAAMRHDSVETAFYKAVMATHEVTRGGAGTCVGVERGRGSMESAAVGADADVSSGYEARLS